MKNVATISGMSADALRGAIFFLTALFFVSSADAPAQAITVNGGNLSMTITAGVAGGTYLFAVPGSPGACKDAWDDILVHQLDVRYRPCNFVEMMPRLTEHLKK